MEWTWYIAIENPNLYFFYCDTPPSFRSNANTRREIERYLAGNAL